MINQGYPPTTPTLKPKDSFTSSDDGGRHALRPADLVFPDPGL